MDNESLYAIFRHSVAIHGKEAYSKTAIQDTTVQENNITFPTDAKLTKKVIDKCKKIAKKEKVSQRQSYSRKSKELVRNCYNSTHPRRAKKARASMKKLKTIAGRVVRELKRKLDSKKLKEYEQILNVFEKVISQEKKDKNKIYSLHKLFTTCIAKGKAHKKYEFGNKIGLMKNSKNQIIQGITSYEGNPHDSKTIAPLLEQAKENFNYVPKEVVYDRGGKGKKKIGETEILTPGKPRKTDSKNKKTKRREKFRKRAGIEPVIAHLKKELRMFNYLSGESSPKISAMLAASGWNFKLMMKNLKKGFLCLIINGIKNGMRESLEKLHQGLINKTQNFVRILLLTNLKFSS